MSHIYYFKKSTPVQPGYKKMPKICYLMLLYVACAYRLLPESPKVRSVLGPSAHQMSNIDITSIPYHVLVFYSNLFCSGALIGSRIVITAASCFESPEVKPYVKVGTDSFTDVGQIIPVVQMKLHEYFKYRSQLDNDIAMLVLEHQVEFSEKTKKVTLVEHGVSLREGTAFAVSGWGVEESSTRKIKKLIWTTMMVMDRDECITHYGNLITNSMFCGKYGPGIRLTDNGGPAVFSRTLLVGISSLGADSRDAPFFAVFTNVSYFYKWIKLNTIRFLRKYCKPEYEDVLLDTYYPGEDGSTYLDL